MPATLLCFLFATQLTWSRWARATLPSCLWPMLEEVWGSRYLYGKLEYQNPTGSFKDRGNAVQVTVLKEAGITEIADSTAGNAGNSTATYCARAGIRYIGFAEEGVRDRKAEAMALHGAELHWVKGDRQARRVAVRKFCEDTGILFFDYGSNAYFNEGQKTIAYEIAEQMDTPPDHIIAATGNGSVLMGLWKGFGECWRMDEGSGCRVSTQPKQSCSSRWWPLTTSAAGIVRPMVREASQWEYGLPCHRACKP